MGSSHIMGDVWKLSELRKSLIDLSRTNGVRCAQYVASKMAPLLTNLMQASFDSGQTIFDESRPVGERGNRLSLVDTGAVRSSLRWVQAGRIVRVALGQRYAKYLIGKYKIMPSGNQELPFRWQNEMLDTANDAIAEWMGQEGVG